MDLTQLLPLTLDFEKIMKVLVIGLEVIYIVFAFIMIRQVRLMNASFTTKAGGLFIGFAQIHFLFAVGITILSVLLF